MVMSKFAQALFLALCVGILVVHATWAAMANTADEKRVALVIGNNDYDHAVQLDNPRNDAKGIADALARLNFDTTLTFDLDQQGMQTTLRDFEERIRDADVALFYYAGHGLQTRGKNYLVSTDADLTSESDLHFNTIDLQIILDFMQDPNRTNIIILDACRDYPLAEQLALSLPKSRTTAAARGLARVESGVGTLVAFATAPGDFALDGDGAHSPFGQSLLKHIETPDLEIRQLFTRVRDDVYRSTDGLQIPWDNSSLRSDFYFKRDVDPAPAKPVAQAETSASDAEFLFWETIKDDSSPENYEEFLRLFPESVFANVAKQRLAHAYDPNGTDRIMRTSVTPIVPAPAVSEAPPQVVAQPVALQEDQAASQIATMETPLARSIADGWQHQSYSLRGNGVHGCRGTGRESAKVGDWQSIDPNQSPIALARPYDENDVYTSSSKTFDIAAHLAVQVDHDEFFLVESKRAVGTAHSWCGYPVLSKNLFTNMLARSDYFDDQNLTTMTSGRLRFQLIEFAAGLVAVEGEDGLRNCLTFVGVQSSQRIDGFICRAIGVPIDTSEIGNLLARIKIKGVIG